MARSTYLVVVYPPVAKQTVCSWPAGANGPVVKKVTASSQQEAASIAGVAPGGHALVARESDLQRFDRAEQAPLEQRELNGVALPEAA